MAADGAWREFSIRTRQRSELVELTDQVNHLLADAGIRQGVCQLSVLHTTAALLVNEAEPGLIEDLLRTLDRLIPADPAYAHPDGNGHAHMKAALLGSSKTLSIRDGRLLLGTWQSLFLVEFDGPRERQLVLQLLSA